MMQQASNRNFEDYEWFELLNICLLKKLQVPELNKYLNHYGKKSSPKLRKHEKLRVIQGHITSTTVVSQTCLDGAESRTGSKWKLMMIAATMMTKMILLLTTL